MKEDLYNNSYLRKVVPGYLTPHVLLAWAEPGSV